QAGVVGLPAPVPPPIVPVIIAVGDGAVAAMIVTVVGVVLGRRRAMATLFPPATPRGCPPRRSIAPPIRPLARRHMVVADGHREKRARDVIGGHLGPWAVLAHAHVPARAHERV